MHTSKEVQAAHARIAVLTAHLASGHAGSTDILEVSVRKSSLTPAVTSTNAANPTLTCVQDCAAPTFARPVAVGTRFGRPAAHVSCDPTLRTSTDRMDQFVHDINLFDYFTGRTNTFSGQAADSCSSSWARLSAN